MQYEIFSLGDPDYMIRVLNALASLTQGGTMQTMMKIGILCGVIMASLKATFTAGKDFQLFHFFIAMLLGMTLFGPLTAVTVIVTPLNPVPGSIYGNGQTKIDHVPFGPAVTGFLLSHIGIGLTMTLESAFSTVGSGGGYAFGLANGGFLQKIQLMDAPIQAMRSTGSGPGMPALESSLGFYIHDCSMNAKAMGKMTDSDILHSEDVLSGLAGPVPLVALFTMTQIPPGGDMTTPLTPALAVSCVVAMDRLKVAFGDSTHVASFMDPAMKQFASGTSTSATADITGAFSAIGAVHGQNIGNYMAGLMTAVMAVRSGGIGPVAGSQSALFSVATETAAEQRAYQAMGEENMFLRIMRPMTGFFESLLYALGPFMAFLIGLGPEGLRLITKYGALTLWVMLWFPMLAIINLYEETSLEHAANMLSSVTHPQSLDSVLKMHDTIVGMLTTGSELAAATPALALAILYGGAVTASALQGKLSGGDHINEKLPAPDAMKEMTVFSPSAMNEWTHGAGVQATGAQQRQPGFDMAAITSSTMTSSHAALESASAGFSKTLGTTRADTSQWSDSVQSGFVDQLNQTSTQDKATVASLSQKYGYSVDTGSKFGEDVSNLTSIVGGATVNAGASSGSAGGGPSAKATGSLEGGMRGSDTVTDSAGYSHSMSTTQAEAMGKDQQLRAALAKVTSHAVSVGASQTGAFGQAVQHNEALAKSAASVTQATDTFTTASQLNTQFGVGQHLSAGAASKLVMSHWKDQTSGFSDFMANVQSTPDQARAFAKTDQSLKEEGDFGDVRQRQVAAGLLTLSGYGTGSSELDHSPSASQQRQQEFLSSFAPMLQLGDAAVVGGSANAGRNLGLGANAPDARALSSEVVHGVHGTSATESTVQSHIDGTRHDVGRESHAMAEESTRDHAGDLTPALESHAGHVAHDAGLEHANMAHGSEAIRDQNWAVSAAKTTNEIGNSASDGIGALQRAGVLPTGGGGFSEATLMAWGGGNKENAEYLGMLDAEHHGGQVDAGKRAEIEGRIGPENVRTMKHTFDQGYADSMPLPVGLPGR
jgi:conjugal transfer mating pair stabilization protein TraG